MKIEYLKVRNFLSIGDEKPVEIDFTKLGRIVLIEGINLDATKMDGEHGHCDRHNLHYSNAAGKSSISEALVYGLYGDAVRKKSNHQNVINNLYKKQLEIEVIFSMGDTRYRIVRKRKPDSLQIWQGNAPWTKENQITKGGQPQTQKFIDSVLGMSHKAFVNVVCFGQHNDYNFLDCTPAEQREIAESLLSLRIYEDYATQAKEDYKALKTEYKELGIVYEQLADKESHILRKIGQVRNEQESWRTNILRLISEGERKITAIEEEINQSGYLDAIKEYEASRAEIATLSEAVEKKQASTGSLESALQDLTTKHQTLDSKIHEVKLAKRTAESEGSDLVREVERFEREIKKVESLEEGAKCPHCHGTIDRQHYKHVIQFYRNNIEGHTSKINDNKIKVRKLDEEIGKYLATLQKISSFRSEVSEKLSAIQMDIKRGQAKLNNLSKMERPSISTQEAVMMEKIKSIKEQNAQRKLEHESGGPYEAILSGLDADLLELADKKDDYKKRIEEKEKLLPYYEYWGKVFSDHIRGFIIKGIVPVLNGRMAYWMQFLMSGTRKVTFNEHLDPTIESTIHAGNTLSYPTTCGSEQKRINLSISQAFAHVMTLSAGTFPSLVFLDEISDSIDPRGLRNIYQMICELSKEKQVMVITHNTHLKDMLEGVDTLVMQKEHDITTLITKN